MQHEFTMKADEVVCQLIDMKKSELMSKDRSKEMNWAERCSEAYLIQLDISADQYHEDESKEFHLRKMVNILCWMPGSYVGIFTSVSDFGSRAWEIEDWKYRSYHSSCWKYDGVERGLDEHFRDIQKQCPEGVEIKCNFHFGELLGKYHVEMNSSKYPFEIKVFSPREWEEERRIHFPPIRKY